MSWNRPSQGGSPSSGAGTVPPSAAGCVAASGAGDDGRSPATEAAVGARFRQRRTRPASAMEDSERPAAGGARARVTRKRPAQAMEDTGRPAADEAASPSAPPIVAHVAPSALGGACQCTGGNCGVPRCRTRALSRLPCGNAVHGDAHYCVFCECEVRGCARPRNKKATRSCH